MNDLRLANYKEVTADTQEETGYTLDIGFLQNVIIISITNDLGEFTGIAIANGIEFLKLALKQLEEAESEFTEKGV